MPVDQYGVIRAYNLKLDGDDSEVENLHSRPKHKVRLESRQVHVPELLRQCSLTTPLGDRHVGEEARQTYTSISVQDLGSVP